MMPQPNDAAATQGPQASARLTLAESRAIIARAIAKAEELSQKGAFVVVDDGGHVISISRMDGAGPAGVPISRSKAFVAAVFRQPSSSYASRLRNGFTSYGLAYQSLLREKAFPGEGALPIYKQGQVVGAISTGGGLGPFLKFEGVDPARFLVNGQPANAEDLIICHALEIPYRSQHGDDMPRWLAAYGEPPETAPAG